MRRRGRNLSPPHPQTAAIAQHISEVAEVHRRASNFSAIVSRQSILLGWREKEIAQSGGGGGGCVFGMRIREESKK